MDECARETVLEAMQQNNIRPFTNTRTDLLIENVSIPPPPKKGKKKKKGGRKKNITEPEESSVVLVEEVPTRLMFETMKEAIDAGWKVSHGEYESTINFNPSDTDHPPPFLLL